MSDQEDTIPGPSDERIEWLATCDEAIARGASPAADDNAAGSLREGAELLGLLHRLDRLRRRGVLTDYSNAAIDWEASGGPLPRAFGHHELLERIAHGGMGVVYKARQHKPHRDVALKMLSTSARLDVTDVRRFRLEAEAAAHLDHPNIVPIYEVGQVGNQPFFTMKLMEGGSLEALVGPLVNDPRGAARIVASIAEAVNHAHQHGILHRDLKPANVLLDAEGRPYVGDFGLARTIEGDSSLTQSGAVVGTPSYMAPEQATGARGGVTTAADVYSLGAILYTLIAGQPPFRGATPVETLRLVLDQEPRPPRAINPRIDRDLEAICLKALAKQPRRRYASAATLAEELSNWLAGKPVKARRIGRAERIARWAKRRPAIAALSGLLMLLAAISLIGMGVLYRQALVARGTADQHAAKALVALGQAEHNLYINRIALADRYRQAHDPDRAGALLDECPPGLRDWEWRYLKRRAFENDTVYHSLSGGYAKVAFSPDSRYLVSIDAGRQIHVRDRVRSTVRELPGLPSHNSALALSPDGQWMAVGGTLDDSQAGAIRLWSTRDWSEVKALPFTSSWPHALAFSPDSRRLVAGYEDDSVRVWDIASGRMSELSGHRRAVQDVAFSPKGDLIASAGRDATVRIWDGRTHESRAILAHERPVFGLAFHPTKRLLATATGDLLDGSRADLSLWDPDAMRRVNQTSALGAMVFKIRFSPNGRRLATTGWDRVVRLWDADTLNELLPLTGHDAPVMSVAFSSDGNLLATGAFDQTIRCWNAAPVPEPRAHAPSRSFSGSDQPIYVLTSTPDSRRLITAGEDGVARVWDVESGRELVAYRKHKYALFALAVSPDGRIVASGGDGRPETIHLWDAATGAAIGQLRGHTGPIMALAFHPDGIRLVSASQDGTVRLWDTRTGEQLHQFLQSPNWICAVAFSADGARLVAAGDQLEIHVWEVEGRQLLHVMKGHTLRVVALAFHPTADRLLSASIDGTVRLWDTISGRPIRVYDGVRGRALAWGPDGQHFAVSNAGGSLHIREQSSGRRTLTLGGDADDLTGALFSRDGRHVVTTGWDHRIQFWDTTPDAPDLGAGEAYRLVGHRDHVAQIAALPDGKRALSCGLDRTIRLWDLTTARELRPAIRTESFVYSRAVTADGNRLIADLEDRDIRIWDIESGVELRRFHPHRGAIFGLAVTPDGRHAVSAGALSLGPEGWGKGPDTDLHIWDLNTMAEVRRLSGHQGGIWSVAISPDGRRAASASLDATVRVWDLANGAQVRQFQGYPNFFAAVAFLPDGRLLSCGADFHFRISDLDAVGEGRRLDGPGGPVDGLAISPDGHRALSCGADRALRVWDLDTGYELFHYEAPHVDLSRGVFTPDGRQALWGASDGVLRAWNIPRGSSRELVVPASTE